MTRTMSTSLKHHFAAENLTVATCWKITRTDAVVLGFTDHIHDISFGGVEYMAATGFEPTDIEQRDDMSVDNMEVAGIIDLGSAQQVATLDAAAITEADVQAGLYDYAEIEIFMVNYEDVSQGALVLKRGWIGEVTVRRGQFVAEVRGLAQKLSQHIGRLYGPSCDAILGDARCGVDITQVPYKSDPVAVTAVTSNALFATNGAVSSATFFKGGELVWLTGNNAGARMEVKEYPTDAVMELVLPMSQTVQVGDTFYVIAGCDKSAATCQGTFNNLLNFRGFPDLPGQDKIFETSGTFR